MPGWSLNPFWEDEVEDSSRTAFDEPRTSSSQSSVQQPAPIPAPEPVPAPTPSTTKKVVDKKKSSPAEPAKKRAAKKPKTAASHSKAHVLSCSDSEDDVVPATQPPVKRKRPAQEFQLLLLFPIFSKLCRMFNDNWRLTAAASSAVGTAITVAVLLKGLKLATVLDELVVPVLAAFTTAVEIVGFVFIYGWYYLRFDLEFLTGTKLPWIWIAAWSLTPILLVGVSGWWLRELLKTTWNQTTLWPLCGVLVGILVVLVIMAAIAVAKEEQFNLITKIASSFRSSRLWGPEEPMARYVWKSQRLSTEHTSKTELPEISQKLNEIYAENWLKPIDTIEKKFNLKNGYLPKEDVFYKDKGAVYTKHSIPRNKKLKKGEEKFRSPNICIAKTELGGPLACNCNRHFTLNVPDLRKAEKTTSL